MFCNQCGKQLEANSRFCGQCGAPVAYAQPAPVIPQPTPPVPAYQPPVQPEPVYQPPVQPEPVYQPPVQPTPTYQAPVQKTPEWTYQSPVQQKAPTYQQPVQQQVPTYQPPLQQPWSYVPEQKKEKKPVNKRKLFATLAASLLILALAAGVLAYFLVFNTPEYKVYTAANATLSELRDALGEGENLVTMAENVKEMFDNKEMRMNVNVDGQNICFDYSADDELFEGQLEIEGMEVLLSANEDELMLSLPDVLSETYSIPLKDFGKELCDWDMLAGQIPNDVRKQLEGLSIDLFADSSWSAFKETEDYEKFKEKLIFEETEKSIPNAASVATVYRIKVGADDVMSMLLSYAEFVMRPILGEELASMAFGTSFAVAQEEMLEDFRGIDIVALVGINEDDCITALHVCVKDDGEEESIAIILAGKNNPWELIELYVSDELMGTLRIETDGEAFDVYADTMHILRGDGTRLILAPERDDPFVLYYGTKENGCQLSADIDSLPIEIELLPDHDGEMISGKAVNIFSMTQRELEALGEELEDFFG